MKAESETINAEHSIKEAAKQLEDGNRMVFTVIGVMQGCVSSPVLFNILLEVVIVTVLALEGNGIVETIPEVLLQCMATHTDIGREKNH